MRNRWWGFGLAAACCVSGTVPACGTAGDKSEFRDPGLLADGGRGDATLGDGSTGPVLVDDDAGTTPLDPNVPLVIAPVHQAVDVVAGQPPANVTFSAFINGTAVAAQWSVDRGEIGTIGPGTGIFVPGGNLGGKATVTASYRGKEASTSVTVRLRVSQNGAPPLGDAGTGSGGVGGVGGEGPGGQVDAATQAILRGAPTMQSGLDLLYPYNGTVWPRGILAPLLQWSPGGRSYRAVFIKITEAAFAYEGFFTKPAAATTFNRHPVPQDVWRQLAYSNGGEDVTVQLTFVEGNVAYGPITQKWKIAQGTLKGTVYYNSYGTALAKNYGGGLGGFARFGGATLSIRGNSTDPTLVAGADGGNAQCRVCHSVAANGSVLITQHGNAYGTSGAYALGGTPTETVMPATDGRFEWPALSPDGTFLFSNSSGPGPNTGPSALFAVPTGTAIPSTGLPANLRAATPAFSPDGKHVAFNVQTGPSADGKSIATMDFDPVTKTFANYQVVFTPPAGTAVWPSFLPTNDGLVFQLETRSNGRDFAGTRSDCESGGVCSNNGVRAELWWLSLATKTAFRLDKLNGVGHVPKGENGHEADETLTYEPTVNPVPSGGYAWVVVMSRRLYGNVATINPFWSDPRFHDISVTPTTKKLWVAAVDLNAPPGTDPSHPAFYLPAQELLAGNARGFWVVDPCHKTGDGCETGDECCGGFCRPAGDGGALVCTDQKPVCAQEFEKCSVDADCCGVAQGIRCINGRCAQPSPR